MIMLSRFLNSKLVILYCIITVILFSGHAWYTVDTTVVRLVFPAVLIFAIPVVNVFIKRNLNLHYSSFLLMCLMVVFTTLVGFGASFSYYFQLICIIFCAFGISLVYSFDDFVDIYLKIMTLVTVIGIIGYVLVLNTSFLEFLPEYENVNDVVYKIGIIYNYIPTIVERNCAMFWEPGIFATHLIFSFVFEVLFKKGKMNILRLILFSVGIITANSAAGFLLLFLSVWLLVTKKERNGKSVNPLRVVMSALIFLVGIAVLVNLDAIISSTSLADNEYAAKLMSDNVEASSRSQAITHNLNVFISAPIFGAGASTVFSNVEHVADTSTSTYIMSMFGTPGILYTFFWLYGVFKQKEQSLLTRVILASIIIIILNKEPHLNMLFTWCLFFFLLKDNKSEEEQKNPIIGDYRRKYEYY